MPSCVEDFAFIAQRVNEIRAARFRELCISPPAAEQPQPMSDQPAAAAAGSGGFKYAPGFEYLGGNSR
jgi:hypothetical protein